MRARERTEIIYNPWGQAIGKRTYKADGKILEHMGDDAYSSSDPELERARHSRYRAAEVRRRLEQQARAATVAARATERHTNNLLGLPTIVWQPRTDFASRLRHANVYLPSPR